METKLKTMLKIIRQDYEVIVNFVDFEGRVLYAEYRNDADHMLNECLRFKEEFEAKVIRCEIDDFADKITIYACALVD